MHTAEKPETKHTAGPWKIASQRGHVFCVVAGPVDIGLINKLDDARLIAAAPDLLAALKSIEAKADQMASDREQHNRGLWAGCRDEARAAIALAEQSSN